MRTTLLLILICITKFSYASTQSAYVEKVVDDKAIISSSSGKYLIEKGVGCVSLWRYEGKSIIIFSPGIFLGVGSKVLLPNENQECRIWGSESM